jgi:hypothetical protein
MPRSRDMVKTQIKRPAQWDATKEAYAWARGVRTGEPLAKSQLIALTHYVNDKFECYVGIDTLAADTDVHPDTVRRRLALLEQIGAIVRTPQWLDNGQRNAEGRGKRTTDLIKLRVDRDSSSVEPRVISANGTIVTVPPAEQNEEGANAEVTPDFPPGPHHAPGHPSAIAQPPQCSKGLISEHEHEDSPPAPPPGGVV